MIRVALKVPTTVLRSADDLDQEHLIWLIRTPPSIATHPTPHHVVREGIQIENTWKGEEKSREEQRKRGERIRERTRKTSREGWG